MDQLNQLTQALKKRMFITSLAILITLLLTITVYAQNYNKIDRRYQKSHFKENETRLVRACHILNKKRNYIPRKSFFASHRRPKTNAATPSSEIKIGEFDLTADAGKATPVVKPSPTKPKLINPKIEHVSEEKLEALHKKEDEVLANNDLPVPTSQKHEQVRKKIADKLASKTNVYPLVLDPLFFQFNEDEFSVVDMEPFLIAAEYAMQGRTVLIEGHTDSRGQNDFNVKLSIKRVQKIRQLMIDMGVPDDRISVVGYGEEQEKQKSTSDHQLNRRVDFTIF